MSTITYQFLSYQHYDEVQVRNGFTVLNVRQAIAKTASVPTECIDLVDMGDVKILRDDELVQNDKCLSVIEHTKNRQIPTKMKTNEPDITDDSITEQRVLMSCNHALTPENLYYYITVTLQDGIPCICCFKCKTAWDFEEVSVKSCMSKDEMIFWGAKLSINAISKDSDIDAATCPKCGLICQRADPSNSAVRCIFCTQKGNTFDFCWDCRKRWTYTHVCGSLQEKQDILSNCDRKTIEYSNITNVPSMRACPKCMAIIEHIAACKQMECKLCGTNFCFICLEVCVNKRLSCSAFNMSCQVADIQTVKR